MENLDLNFQAIKKEFFIYKNGIITESLRRLYPQGVVIYGLMVPQIAEIARKYTKNLDLGKKLWNDANCRESRLLALYILPADKIDKEFAKNLINEVRSNEEADLLAFKILRLLPFGKDLYLEMKDYNMKGVQEYCRKMFRKNLEATNQI